MLPVILNIILLAMHNATRSKTLFKKRGWEIKNIYVLIKNARRDLFLVGIEHKYSTVFLYFFVLISSVLDTHSDKFSVSFVCILLSLSLKLE